MESVQGMVDQEGERRVELARSERDACEAGDNAWRLRLAGDIDECDARTQALALLSMFLFTALHLCQDQIVDLKEQQVPVVIASL